MNEQIYNNTDSYSNLKLERLCKWQKEEKADPFSITVFPTNRCNLNCIFCEGAYERKYKNTSFNSEISDELIERICEEGVNLHIKEWEISGGGEPFIRKHAVMNMIKIIKKVNDTKVKIITNGTLLNKIDARNLVLLNLDDLFISIDGFDKKTHDYVRDDKTSFSKCIKLIENISYFKKKFKIKSPQITMNSIIHAKNYKKLSSFLPFIVKKGVNNVELHPLIIFKETFKYLDKVMMKEQEIKAFLNILNAIEKNKLVSKNIIPKLDTFRKRICLSSNNQRIGVNIEKIRTRSRIKTNDNMLDAYCLRPWFEILIDSDGKCGFCGVIGSGDESINIRNYSLREIWFEKYDILRKAMLIGGYKQQCSKCEKIINNHELKNTGMDTKSKHF